MVNEFVPLLKVIRSNCVPAAKSLVEGLQNPYSPTLPAVNPGKDIGAEVTL
jgi:hypothetical protein